MRCLTNKVLFHIPKQWFVLFCLSLIVTLDIQAEGVQQIAPTEADSPVMLESGRPDFANFAAYDGPESGRLYISIKNPTEIVYLGLSIEYNNRGQAYTNNVTSAQYRYRIKRVNDSGTDPIVHGPFLITTNNANLSSWSDAVFGSYDVTETDGGGNLMYEFHPDTAGEYYIEFDDVANSDSNDNLPEYRKVNIGLWDITVTENNLPIDGRVWSRNWALRTPELTGDTAPDCEWDRPFKGTFYSYTNDKFVSKIDFSDAGMQGLTFLVAFNSTGPGSSGDLSLDRMSIPDANATANASQHQIFLSPPDPDLFPSGECGTLISDSSFRCSGLDSFCLEVTVSKPGQVEVIIDFNQNGILDDNSQDVSILYEFPEGMLTNCIPWDGLRGDGSLIGITDTVNLVFHYSQGIQHWSAYDVEFMRNGYCIETIRPICPNPLPSTKLYWDDRNIIEEPGTGALKDGRNGCNCNNATCRSWDNFNINSNSCSNVNDANTTGYGDKTTLNTWWYATVVTSTKVDVPLVNIMITGPDSTCEEEPVTFTALDEGTTGNITYQWSGPDDFMANTASVSVVTAGEYCVTISDDLGCSSDACKTLTILDSPAGDISYPDNITACSNTTILISPIESTIGFSFLWSPISGGIIDPSLPVQNIDFTNNTTYTVQVTNNDTGCSITETIIITAFLDPVANFTTETGCEQGLEIDFMNTSTNGVSYLWDFGDPSTTADTSIDPSPSYTYPAVGDYLVELAVTSADGCTTIVTQTVSVIAFPLAAGFDVDYGNCDDNSVTVQLTNTSINGANNIASYSWAFNVPPLTSIEENPTFTLSNSQSVTAILTIATTDGCISSNSQTFDVVLGPPSEQFPDNLLVCPGTSVQITPSGDPSFTYNWSPTEGVNDPTSAQPTFNPTVSTIYTVTITASGVDDCSITETVEVTVPEEINLQVTGGGVFCTPTATLTATTDIDATVVWQNADGDQVGTGLTLTVDVSGDVNYTAIATDNLGCFETAADVTVSGGPVNFSTPDTVAVCLGEEIILDITNLDANDILTYNWAPAELFVPGTTTNAIPDYLEAIGTEEVTVTLTNQYGCEAVANIHVAVIDPTISLGFTSLIDCSGGTVNFTNTSTNAFGYIWNFGDGNTSFEESPEHVYASGGTYTVTLDIIYDVSCVATPFTQEIMVEAPQIIAGFTYDITGCTQDSVIIQFTDNSTNSLNNTNGYSWTFNPASPTTSTEQNPSVVVYNSGSLEVSFTIFTENDCSNTLTENLDIELFEIEMFFEDTLIVCPGEPTQIGSVGDPNLTYSWSPTEGIDDPTSSQPIFSPTVSTLYTVTITTSNDCTATETVEVIVPDEINLEVTGGGVFCTATTTLTASTNVNATIVWYTAGDSIGTGNTIMVDVGLGETIYTVIATDDFECTEAIMNVSVSDGPVDFSVPDTVAVCLGEEIILNVTNLDPNDVLTYSWTPVNLFAPGTANDPVPDYLEVIGTEDVMVTLTNQHNCEAVATIHVAVVDPTISLSFTSLLDCDGRTVSFTNTSTNAFGYVWNFGDSNTSFEENPVHVYDDAGTYTVTLDIIYDVNCVMESFSQEIEVDIPEITANFTYDIVACSADSAIIQFFDNSTNSLSNPMTWAWTFNQANPMTSMDQNPSVTVYNSDPLQVSLTITTENNCSDTYTETLEIQLVDLDISLNDTIVVCLGGSQILNPDGDPALVYNWTPTTGLDNPTATSPVVTPTETTTYFATAYSLVGSDTCFVTDSVVVFVPGDINLVLDQEPVVLTCGEDVVITATADVAIDVVWISTLNGVLEETSSTIIVNPFQIDTIIAIATDQYGCTATDSIIVNDMGVDITVDPSDNLVICDDVEAILSVLNYDSDDVLTYQWSPDEYIVGATTLDSAIIRINELGEFIITAIVTNQHGCTDTVDVSVTVEDFAGLQLDTIIVCANEPTPINPGGDPLLVYNWSPNDEFLDLSDPSNPIVTTNMPLTYYVTITDNEFGCTAMDSIFIDISPEMNLNVTPPSTTLCSEGTVTLTANTDITPANVEWFLVPDIPVGSGMDVTFTPPLGASLAYAVATSEAGCTESDTVTINNFPINASITDSIIFCEPMATIDLNITNNDSSQDLDIVWNVDPPVEGPVITVDLEEGENSFSATVTNQFGCSDDLNTSITVIDLLGNINIGATPDSILLNESSVITVTGCVGCTYEWDPAAEDSPIITVTPTEAGDNIYTVTASLLGCEQTLDVNVFVLDAMCDVDHVYFPNAFTPNGDGENDVIRLRSEFTEELLEYELLIYDRWGEEIFHSFDPFEYWNGTFRGEQLAPDVYGYYLRVLCPMGEELIQKGNITLLR